MEWTDGMEYQLTKIDKTLHCGRGEVDWTVMYVQFLFSSLVPRPTRGMFGDGEGYVLYIIHAFGSMNVR